MAEDLPPWIMTSLSCLAQLEQKLLFIVGET